MWNIKRPVAQMTSGPSQMPTMITSATDLKIAKKDALPTAPDTFPLFCKLPTEVRLMIWNIKPPQPGLFHVKYIRSGEKSSFEVPSEDAPLLALRQVCRESRAEFLRYFVVVPKMTSGLMYNGDDGQRLPSFGFSPDLQTVYYSAFFERKRNLWGARHLPGATRLTGRYAYAIVERSEDMIEGLVEHLLSSPVRSLALDFHSWVLREYMPCLWKLLAKSQESLRELIFVFGHPGERYNDTAGTPYTVQLGDGLEDALVGVPKVVRDAALSVDKVIRRGPRAEARGMTKTQAMHNKLTLRSKLDKITYKVMIFTKDGFNLG